MPFRSVRLIFLGLLGYIFSTVGFAAEFSGATRAAAQDLRAIAEQGSDAYKVLESLTVEVGQRAAGSAGDAAGVAWALATLNASGFSNVRAEAVKVPYWERGTLRVSLPEFADSELVAVSLGGSIGTPAGGISARVTRFDTLASIDALPEGALEGRIAFIDQRMSRSKTGSGYGKTVSNRVRGASIAAGKGALALVIRSVGTSEARIANTGTMIYSPGAPKIPAVALAHPDADRLTRLLSQSDSVSIAIHSTARQLANTTSANVIAELVGGKAPEEIVVLAAHLDSWDLGTGALDDGAGVAIMIEAMRQIARVKPRPERTLRIVLYANEEFGLSGARQYRADHDDTLENHIVAMESDFGAGKIWQFNSRVADSALPWVAAIHAQLEPLGIESGDNTAFGGADIGPLREAGVPVLGLAQDGTYYFDYHHTVDDTLDKVDADDLDQNVAAMAVAAYLAANSEVDFGRLPAAKN